MKRFVDKYLDKDKELKILEVGSKNTHNPAKQLIFRRYFKSPKWKFVGMDIEPGNNVDVVTDDLYHYPFKDGEFDLVISGNTMEHVEDIYAWVKELARISNNMVFIMVPNMRPEHRYPIDCWRVYPDGLRFILEKIAGLEVIECHVDGGKIPLDTMAVAKKKK